MRKRAVAVMTAIAVTVLALAGCAPQTAQPLASAQADSEEEPNSITVSAQGVVTTMPDVAYITVGVTTQGSKMQQAQEDNAEAMSALYEALEREGMAREDIRTTQYSAYPIYDYNSSRKRITGYEVTNLVELTIRDIGKVGDIIDIAVNSGANMTGSVSFGILDPQAVYNEALALAVQNARAKADAMASAGGVRIVGTLSITENSTGGQVYREYPYAEAEDAAAETPISAGDMDVTASVIITYEIG